MTLSASFATNARGPHESIHTHFFFFFFQNHTVITNWVFTDASRAPHMVHLTHDRRSGHRIAFLDGSQLWYPPPGPEIAHECKLGPSEIWW